MKVEHYLFNHSRPPQLPIQTLHEEFPWPVHLPHGWDQQRLGFAPPIHQPSDNAFLGRTGEFDVSRFNADNSFDLDAFTLAAWVKPESHRNSQVLLSRGDAGKLFTLYLHENRVRMLVEYRPGRYTHANCPQPPVNVWTHLAGSYDGREIRVYVNGELQHAVAAPGRISKSGEPLFIGALAPDARAFHGRLEDIRVWDRALADLEIAQAASGRQDAALNHGLVARWRNEDLRGSQWPSHGGSGLIAQYHADGTLQVRKADGYRGIWYQCGEQGGAYRYKYSGGLGTYCAKHRPFAVYAEEVNKTFFCYGGTDAENSTLLHMVSYYHHPTGTVPRPTILLDKHTTDAHDNPVISLDAAGHIWVFSSAHGTARPAYVSVSKRPYDV
ncbi:MAG: LamG domain-containing protein, partial [Planctomycetota bacterium]